MPLSATTYAVRFVWAGNTLDFDEPALIVLATPQPVAGANRTYSGKTEWLFSRIEDRLSISWGLLSKAKADSVLSWWWQHYAQGRQTAITLDRLGTAVGQFEFDNYNTLFSRAEPPDTTIPPFPIARAALSLNAYTIGPLVFRQGNP